MTVNSESKIGGILLAAGGSSRLGQPKQLLEFQGRTLIRRATEMLVDSRCDPVVVVLGAEVDISKAEVGALPVHICLNVNWQTGMSSSIRAGLGTLLDIERDLSAVVITLCDQPFVSAPDLDLLIREFRRSDAEIVAARYGETVGVPALFTKDLFAKLAGLEGDRGAFNLIAGNRRVATIDLAEAAFDIDVAADIATCRSIESGQTGMSYADSSP